MHFSFFQLIRHRNIASAVLSGRQWWLLDWSLVAHEAIYYAFHRSYSIIRIWIEILHLAIDYSSFLKTKSIEIEH